MGGLFDATGDGGALAGVAGGLQGLLEAYKMKLGQATEEAKLRQSGFNAGHQPKDDTMSMLSLLERIRAREGREEFRDLLSPTDAGQLGVPYGTTKHDAAGKGIIPASQTTRLNLQKTQELKPILDSLSSQFEALNFPEDSLKASAYAPLAFAKSKMAGSKERTYAQTSENISKLVKSMGESGALSTGDVERMKKASVGSFYETKGSGRYKLNTLRDIADEGNFNMKSGLTGSAIDTAPPARLTDYLTRKKAAGISQEFAITRARELLEQGRLVQ